MFSLFLTGLGVLNIEFKQHMRIFKNINLHLEKLFGNISLHFLEIIIVEQNCGMH